LKVSYRQAASDDVVRQFRYYLFTLNLPEVAVRFRDAVRLTVQSLLQHPLIGYWTTFSFEHPPTSRLSPRGRLSASRPSGFTIYSRASCHSWLSMQDAPHSGQQTTLPGNSRLKATVAVVRAGLPP
jgi:plasmid stabilization system protein ParE